MNGCSIVFHELVEGLCLGDCSRKSVEQKALCSRILVQLFFEHGDGDLIGNKRAAIHDLLYAFTQRSVVLGVPAKKITGGDVNKAILLDEFFTLSTFSCTWRAEQDKINHDES